MRWHRPALPADSPAISSADLIDAPQLAAISLLASSIRVAHIALLAAHSELLADDHPLCGRFPDRATRIAEHLVRCTSDIAFALREYQSAVAEVLELDEHGTFEIDPF